MLTAADGHKQHKIIDHSTNPLQQLNGFKMEWACKEMNTRLLKKSKISGV